MDFAASIAAMLRENCVLDMTEKHDQGIVLDRVSLSRDGLDIIENMSTVMSERRIGIVGRNGSGKTTLARLICGLVAPSSGRVTVDGVDVAKDRVGALKAIGIVFQNPDHQIIFPTVEQEIAFGIEQSGRSGIEARQIAQETLAEFGKRDWADLPTHSLSQGQRHLVCLLSIAAMRPAYLVLDEPFTGPDIPTVQHLRRYLNRISSSQIVITHDVGMLKDYCRVIWLERGHIVADGPAETVLTDYSCQMKLLAEQHDFPDIAS